MNQQHVVGNRHRNPLVQAEIDSLLELGYRQLTIDQMSKEIRDLGYRFDRNMDCKGTSRHLTGKRAGATYPCCTLYMVQIDDGKSFAHFEARRDSKFQELQALRDEIFAVSRGRIYTM